MSRFAPLGLAEALREIEDGLTPAVAIERARRRIEAEDGALHAFTALAPMESLEAAARTKGPLTGIPLAFKDIFDTADMATEYGSPIYRGHRPMADAPLVTIARSLGAAVMGKTATTEFAFLQPTATQNPAAPGHTPGGSSSGSAAAVAAGLVAGAFGSQTAGSVIRPASFCGVAGYKPSFRLLPTVGIKGFAWTLDTVGLFAGSVTDAALLAQMVSGRQLAVTESPSALRVGLYRSHLDEKLEPAMRDAWERASAILEKAGAHLVEIREPFALARAHSAQARIQLYEGAVSLAHERRVHAESLSPCLHEAMEEGAAMSTSAYDEDRRTARGARKEVTKLFEKVDVLLAPSTLGPAPEGLDSTGDPAMNRLWTLTGNPCINVPGLTADGLPLGLSVIARFGQDARALAAGAWLEHLIRTS